MIEYIETQIGSFGQTIVNYYKIDKTNDTIAHL